MARRKELKSALARRYRMSSRVEQGRILDEFVRSRASLGSMRCGCCAAILRADTALGGCRPGVWQASEAPAADLNRWSGTAIST